MSVGLVRMALVQVEVAETEPPADRVVRVADLVGAQAGLAEVVLLPELWHVGAFDLVKAREFAEPIDGPLVATMSAAAAAAQVWLHAGSYAELEPSTGNRYNTSLLFDPSGTLVATYRKQYLFGWQDGEPSVMTAGDQFVVVHTPLGMTGLATCYDLRFPEMFRGLVDAGATAFLLGSGWPTRRIEHWTVLARARAIENQAWMIACNTAGTHAETPMGGRSLVVDPLGVVVAEAGEAEQVLYVQIDPGAPADWRQKFPVLTDRR